MNATQLLAEFITHESPDIPDIVRRRAVRYVVDTFAVTLAGARDPAVQRLEKSLAGHSDGIDLPWTPTRFREDDACLLAGMASHILDFDDVCMLAILHPGAPIFSALQILARSLPISGEDFITSYIVGTEIMIRCGEALGYAHYGLGFHSTGTLGVLGVTAACARAAGLDVQETRHALAIAASQSAGLKRNFGSMVKSLHVGFAASNGLKSVRLATAGLLGADDIMQDRGWLHAFSGGSVSQWPEGVQLGRPYAISHPGFEQKRFPCCYLMHKIICATLELRNQHDLGLQGLERALVTTCRGGSEALIHHSPETGLDAKFSGTYAVIASLQDGHIGLGSFKDEAVLRSEIQQALRRVRLEEVGETPGKGSDVGDAPVTVTLTYNDGREFTCTVTKSPGSLADPMTDEQLLEKWLDCLSMSQLGLPSSDQKRLFAEGLAIESVANVNAWLNFKKPDEGS
ncbi:MmgE/PrpD family protein [Paraburkholderia sp. BCC1886]|uniref:MmgE/PrpD family protein n=1 Tax=Paraburkholderia sp. BCC1886 TaxID=2562670 RepID=UPI00118249F7|nr:MmgE/PrpD family protein [Paraburkholderia sp. BCC1886]